MGWKEKLNWKKSNYLIVNRIHILENINKMYSKQDESCGTSLEVHLIKFEDQQHISSLRSKKKK
jgi:hypothetical protein